MLIPKVHQTSREHLKTVQPGLNARNGTAHYAEDSEVFSRSYLCE